MSRSWPKIETKPSLGDKFSLRVEHPVHVHDAGRHLRISLAQLRPRPSEPVPELSLENPPIMIQLAEERTSCHVERKLDHSYP
jgi:hypothetical protein